MSYILITGCNGFIGSRVAEVLLKEGHNVLGISIEKKSNIKHSRFKYISVNITDCLGIEKVFKENDISTVIHLAAIAHKQKGQKVDWNTYYRVNTLASKIIFGCAARVKADIIFASTVDVYGACEDRILTEDSMPKPVSDYGISKYQAENILMEIAKDNELDYIILRFAPVYSAEHMKDIYKRIYLKEPSIALLIGSGLDYYFVSINKITKFIAQWIKSNHKLTGRLNFFDKYPMNSKEMIKRERENKKAKIIIFIPLIMTKLVDKALCFLYGVSNSNKLLNFHIAARKLIRPPRYASIKQLEEIIT